MKVIFAAGGTAGHINPALAIADSIKSAFPETEILFIGTPNGMESRLVVKAGYAFEGVEMAGFQRKISARNVFRNVKAAYCYLISAKRAVRRIIGRFKPDLAVGTGGYVTATVLGQAAAMGVKTVTHESNSYPGMATKMLCTRADRVFLASEDAMRYLKDVSRCVVTGNPLRTNIPIEERSAARKRLGLRDGFTVLSFGGSLGANKITESVAALIAWEQKVGGINHIHAYGRGNGEVFAEALRKNGVQTDDERLDIREYIDNMYTCMCAADLIVSRSGAMSITELTETGRASVLVPFPNAAENHQYYNAMTLVNENAAVLIEDKDLSGELLVKEVSGLYADRERLAAMEANAARMKKSNAADKILSEIIDLVGREKFEG